MCPECGAGRGTCVQTGYDDKDRVLRLRRCGTCETQYTTAEVPVPGSFYQLADSWRLRQVLKARLVRGYHNTNHGRYVRSRQRLDIEVKVHEPRTPEPKARPMG